MSVEETEQQTVVRQQAIRVRQVLLATSVYMSALIPLFYIERLGMISLNADMKIFGVIAVLLTNAVFFALIRTDVNLHFRDPSMTFAQVLTANVWSLLVAWHVAQPARPLAMVWYLLAFLFGFYTLKRTQFLLLMIFALAGYAVIVLREYLVSGIEVFRVEMLHWLILAAGLFWMSLVGSYVSMLRRRLAEQRRELVQAAFVDPLTRVHNRRYLLDVLQRELARIRRETVSTLSLAMIDLDGFKAINDQHGHLVGDAVLRRVAELIRDEMREMDVVGRYGGEEFIVVMPDTAGPGAAACMERVRRRIENEAGTGHATLPVTTVSIGVAGVRKNDAVPALIDRADKALYAAKKAGRNRVIRSGDARTGKTCLLQEPGG